MPSPSPAPVRALLNQSVFHDRFQWGQMPYLCLCHSLTLRVLFVDAEVSPSLPGEGRELRQTLAIKGGCVLDLLRMGGAGLAFLGGTQQHLLGYCG